MHWSSTDLKGTAYCFSKAGAFTSSSPNYFTCKYYLSHISLVFLLKNSCNEVPLITFKLPQTFHKRVVILPSFLLFLKSSGIARCLYLHKAPDQGQKPTNLEEVPRQNSFSFGEVASHLASFCGKYIGQTFQAHPTNLSYH